MIPCLPLRAGEGVPTALAEMENLLARWAAFGWLRTLDAAFAGFLWREVPSADPWLILAAALASHQLGRGHVCLDLAATLADPAFALSLPPEGDEGGEGARDPATAPSAADWPARVLARLDLPRWLAALDCPALVAAGAGNTPLVLQGNRLYLRRYWSYEQAVRGAIDARLARREDGAGKLCAGTDPGAATAAAGALAAPDPALVHALALLFPAPALTSGAETALDWQKVACALAARSGFSIITGGPGTGKTTTVVKLLALLQHLALSGVLPGAGAGEAAPRGTLPQPLRIRLAAPTGKAAARLNESIAGAIAGLPLGEFAHAEQIRAAIPTTVVTLHRLLGTRPDSRRFRHDADNPLALDVLVVDEASMIDLEMMAAVLAALPAHARLVLLGDKDQLASVEAGAVLGELCARAAGGHYTPATAAWAGEATGQSLDEAFIDPAGQPLDQAVVMLRHSHRFAGASGIGRLAAAVNAGEAAAALKILRHPDPDLQYLAVAESDWRQPGSALQRLLLDGCAVGARDLFDARRGYRHYLDILRATQPEAGAAQGAFDAWARAVLSAHRCFQVLCAVRRGAWGVEGLNARIARLLHAEGLLAATEGWYLGRPVLVTRNDYALGLMNGDIGITLQLPVTGQGGDAPAQASSRLRVAFPAGDGSGTIKWVLPSRLTAVETVFALTVHKSQGSEFDHTALILPPNPSPILTRELLYTGITRARTALTLVNAGGDAIVRTAVERRVLRASGLNAAIALQ